MPREKKHFQQCVYKIIFNSLSKIYIGSTTRWSHRKQEHLSKLRSNQHFNQYLQRTFNKYGEKEIVIEVVEFCDYESLRSKEQYWIDFYNSTDPKFGWNLVKKVDTAGTSGYKFTEEQKKKMSHSAKTRMKNKQERDKISKSIAKKLKNNAFSFGGKFHAKSFNLIDPQGAVVKIYNLCKFCRDNDLNYSKMISVANGRLIEYNGWKLDANRTNLVQKKFEFISPSGELTIIMNLRKFCKEHCLCVGTMYSIHNDKGISCSGWIKAQESAKIHKGKAFIIQNPDGLIIKGNNLSDFCRKNQINSRSLKKGFVSKGFKLINNRSFD
jgi:group I intron endonuclease